MLIQFSFKNFKCFKNQITFSLIASNYDKTTREDDNTFSIDKYGLKLLKSAVVYGANASGKTKLIEGLNFAKNFILNSSKESQISEPIGIDSFRLSSETENEPSTFEFIFIHENDMYRYGFEVDKEKIHSEWLYHKPKTKEIELFYRDGQEFEHNNRRFKVSDLIKNQRIRPNALLLSVAANWNDKVAEKVFEWFNRFHIISGLKEAGYEGYSMARMRENTESKLKTIQFLKDADLGIEDLSLQVLDIENLPSDMPDVVKDMIKKRVTNEETPGLQVVSGVTTYHKKFGANNLVEGMESFSMDDDESSGTKKYFALSGPILETLEKGEVLVVDELANKLHPNLTHKLIEIFNSKKYNPNNAQLIFNTHDTNLLSSGLFRRDQIWFTEKDRYGVSTLFSLGDFKSDKVRKEDNYERNYIKGTYGAIPYLEDLGKIFNP